MTASIDRETTMDIVKAKIRQGTRLLDEMHIDAWALFERETLMQKDPLHDLVVGIDVAWSSLFLYTRRGDAIALVGNFDMDEFVRSGRFTQVDSYVQGAGQKIRDLLGRLDPKSLALNFSSSDPASDGLTHGMYRLLMSYLEGTPYAERIISSQEFVSRLRSRKLPDEIACIERAAVVATRAWERAAERIQPGLTEKDIAAILVAEMSNLGTVPAFEPIVNAGAKTNPGHGHPTDARLEPGDLLHVDFGCLVDHYCSDLQRLIYFRKPGEARPPDDLTRAFECVRQIIDETARVARPGRRGHEVDAVARRMLRDHGYPEYQHALGHQVGRSVHDGGGILGPQWERYGDTPLIAIEPGNVFTLELEIMLPGIGCVGLEEDVAIETDNTRFLCERQLQLPIK
jgi:Xaa-Pro aminopeptidase